MNLGSFVETFFETLIAGDRPAARAVVASARKGGADPQALITDLFWPTYQLIDRLFRSDQLSCLSHNMATRLLRVLIDQNAALLRCDGSRGRTILALCGPSEGEELAAQMALDILEGKGFTVSFAGSSVASDEVLARVHDNQPDVLLMFASAAEDLPGIRQLIDTIREIGSCEGMQIGVGAGVFSRAEGLAEEIGADVWAGGPLEMAQVLIGDPTRRAVATQRTVGRARRPQRKAA